MGKPSSPASRYHAIPKQVSRKDFNHYIAPHLSRPVKGPAPKLSLYQIFNYILYVLHTGIQWNQLKTRRNQLHWSKDGSYQQLLEASILHLSDTAQLDTSLVHGDGSNTVVKKGERGLVTRAPSTRRVKKN